MLILRLQSALFLGVKLNADGVVFASTALASVMGDYLKLKTD